MKETMDRVWRSLAVRMGKHAGVVSMIGLIVTLMTYFPHFWITLCPPTLRCL